MKALKILFGTVIIFSMFALLSCGDSGNKGNAGEEGSSVSSSSPSGVITTVINNVADEDYESVVALYVKKGGEELTKEDKAKLMAFLPAAKQQFDKKGGLKDVKIVDEKISDDGNTATVKYKIIFTNGKEGGTEKVKFLKVNGNWKIRIS